MAAAAAATSSEALSNRNRNNIVGTHFLDCTLYIFIVTAMAEQRIADLEECNRKIMRKHLTRKWVSIKLLARAFAQTELVGGRNKNGPLPEMEKVQHGAAQRQICGFY